MKFDVKQAEPSQEFILEALFGLFALPWLFIFGIMTIVTIVEKISAYKDKKDPSRKLDRLSKWLADGLTEDMFVDQYSEEDPDGYDPTKKIDFSKTDKKMRFPVKNLPDYDDLVAKWKKWQLCVTDLAAISEMKDAGKQIQKVFAKHFTNKDLFTKKNGNNVEYTGITVISRDSIYPDDKWFKPNIVKTAINEFDKTGIALVNSLNKMSAKVKDCMEAPKTHKDDKEYLLGCLNYIATIDKVVSITHVLIDYMQNADDACCRAYWKLNS